MTIKSACNIDLKKYAPEFNPIVSVINVRGVNCIITIHIINCKSKFRFDYLPNSLPLDGTVIKRLKKYYSEYCINNNYYTVILTVRDGFIVEIISEKRCNKNNCDCVNCMHECKNNTVKVVRMLDM